MKKMEVSRIHNFISDKEQSRIASTSSSSYDVIRKAS